MAGIEDLHSSCFDLSPIKPCRPGCCQTQRTFCICFVYQFDGFVGSAMQTDPAMFCATNERMHLPCSAAAMCIWLCQVLVALCRFFVASVSKLFLCLAVLQKMVSSVLQTPRCKSTAWLTSVSSPWQAEMRWTKLVAGSCFTKDSVQKAKSWRSLAAMCICIFQT